MKAVVIWFARGGMHFGVGADGGGRVEQRKERGGFGQRRLLWQGSLREGIAEKR